FFTIKKMTSDNTVPCEDECDQSKRWPWWKWLIVIVVVLIFMYLIYSYFSYRKSCSTKDTADVKNDTPVNLNKRVREETVGVQTPMKTKFHTVRETTIPMRNANVVAPIDEGVKASSVTSAPTAPMDAIFG